MKSQISVVINTLNEAKFLERALKSVQWADEILVCDMHSEDQTVEIAKKYGAHVIFHQRLSYVEPARNFAVSKASNDWVLIIDPDEEIPQTLANKLTEIASVDDSTTYVKIPRQNVIFDKSVKASFWWPDYNLRFFKKGSVKWSDRIHIQPEATGQGLELPATEELAIIHYHYQSISQFIQRMERYTSVQAQDLIDSGYKFVWPDLIKKPLSEFLGRFFANRGFDDGVHGLALCLLQAFSFLVVYLKVWEAQGFKAQAINYADIKKETTSAGKEVSYWLKYGNLSTNRLKRILQKVRNRL